MKNRTVACLLLIIALLTATEFAVFSVNASSDDFWVAKAPIPSPSSDLESVLLNGKVYVIGTNISGVAGTNSNYTYAPATNTWTQKAPMPYFQSDFGLTTYQGQIYVIGGFNGTSNLSNNEQYFPAEYTGSEPLTSPTPSVPEFSLVIFPLAACLSAIFFGSIFLKRFRTKH